MTPPSTNTATALPPDAPAAEGALNVVTISDQETFFGLETAWNRLVEEAGIDHPFLTHEWVRTWWECFGAGHELHILMVFDQALLIAIVPLMLSFKRMYGLRMRLMEFLYNVYTDRFDFIIVRRAKETYQAVWRYMAEHKKSWDAAQLCQLPAESGTAIGMGRLAAETGYLTGVWPSSCSPYIPIAGAWEEYFNSLNRKHRANLRNRLKRLEQLGPVDLEVVRTIEGVDQALEEGWGLEEMAWKGQAGSAVNCQPALREFYLRFAHRAAKRGWLHLQFLRVNGRRIAFGYTLFFNNKLFLLKPGYDPEYAPYSPGNLLCYLALRDAFERGVAEFNFLGENDLWKQEWAELTRPHTWLYIFPRRLGARLVHFAKFTMVPMMKARPLR